MIDETVHQPWWKADHELFSEKEGEGKLHECQINAQGAKSEDKSIEGELPVLHDSGERQQFNTGAVRDPAKGKGRYDLISPHALKRLALHYEAGAEKYADRNWEKGIPMSRCFSSAVRHLFQWLAGMRNEDHLAAAAWNVFAIMHFEAVKPGMMDIEGVGK